MTDNAFSFVAGGTGMILFILIGLLFSADTVQQITAYGFASLVFVGLCLSAWQRRVEG